MILCIASASSGSGGRRLLIGQAVTARRPRQPDRRIRPVAIPPEPETVGHGRRGGEPIGIPAGSPIRFEPFAVGSNWSETGVGHFRDVVPLYVPRGPPTR